MKQELLKGYQNFIKENDNTFKHEFSAFTQGQVMVINGHRMESPGKQVTVKNIIRFDGDGYISDEDEISNKQEFSVVSFESYLDDEEQGSYNECLYWNDTDRFRVILSHFIS
jgi:hypothetical protein